MKKHSIGGLLAALVLVYASAALGERIETLPAKASTGGERRTALVIGNGAYKSAPLRNPRNDAKSMAKALSESGFKVALIEDATLAGMRRAVREFGDAIAAGGVGLFYYAGHGVQLRGRNFLVPVNADIQREDEIEDQSIDANFVLAKMDTAKNSLNILILDACRNNPFARSFRSSSQGLVQMDAPTGTLIAFATAPGTLAADGVGENSVYTKHLLSAIRVPGLPVEQLFKQVRIAVAKETTDTQIPWESSSLRGDFYFSAPAAVASSAEQQDAAIKRALTAALAIERERAALERNEIERKAAEERADQQRRIDQMIHEALAKQRAALEAERKGQAATALAKAPAAVAPALSPAPPASIEARVPSTKPESASRPLPPPQVASVAPPAALVIAAAPADTSRVDRWYYVGNDPDRPEKKLNLLVELLGATPSGVMEGTTGSDGRSGQWVYTAEPALVNLGAGVTMFSPLITHSRDLKVGQTWRAVDVARIGLCGLGNVNCHAEAKVVSAEKITVHAGSFDTFRVVVNLVGNSGRGFRSSGEYTYWYAPATRRIVKYQSRLTGDSAVIGTDPNLDLALAAYQFSGQTAVGSFRRTPPTQVTTLAPSAISSIAAARDFPKVGDTWQYRTRSAGGQWNSDTNHIEVTAISGDRILETQRWVSGQESEVVREPGAGVFGLANHVYIFSPYLHVQQSIKEGDVWEDLPVRNAGSCSDAFAVSCKFSAKVGRKESVTVPAGTFDAYRVEVEQLVLGSSATIGSGRRGSTVRKGVYWFAPAAKRFVKVTWKTTEGVWSGPDAEMELSLLKLN